MSSAPGISLETLFSRTPETALREYVGSSTIEVLSALNPELLNRANLTRLALGAVQPLQALKDSYFRDQIISFLPLAKAQELADRLKISVSPAKVFDALQIECSKKSSESVLLSFFGVVVPEKAPDS